MKRNVNNPLEKRILCKMKKIECIIHEIINKLDESERERKKKSQQSFHFVFLNGNECN